MQNYKVYLTTPDYPPKLGGLSTFSKNVVKVLEELGVLVEVFNWKSPKDLLNLSEENIQADFFFHIHFMGGFLTNFPLDKTINFCHGSEILFTSPNPLKKLIKKLGKAKTLNYFSNSRANFFVSDFTREKLKEKGLQLNYGRDFVYNCSIEGIENSALASTFDSEGVIKLCSIARDVPHKNFDGIYNFSKSLGRLTNRKVQLSITSSRFKSTENLEVIPLLNKSDSELQQVYQDSHFNLLLSLDHSEKGFFEGFGLTTLEAGHFKTPSVVSRYGGLPENIHHRFNGFVLENFLDSSILKFYDHALNEYSEWSKNAYSHSINSHGLNLYKKLFKAILVEGI